MFSVDSRNTQLIAVAGMRGSGKDTVAKHLCSLDDRVRVLKFATPVKATLKQLFDFTDEELEDEILKELVVPRLGFSPRQAMRTLGTEFGRTLNPDVWVNIARESYHDNLVDGHLTIITDLRYKNEYDFVKSEGGIVIHLTTPFDVAVEHSSDVALPIEHDDFVLHNEKRDIGVFHHNIDTLIRVI